MTKRLPNVLIVAENASPQFGGEAILPLIYFLKLRALGRDVWLITHERNRDELSRRLGQSDGRIIFTPDSPLHRFLWALGRDLPASLRDNLIGNLMGLHSQKFQRGAARQLIARHKIDLIHQPIPVSPVAPSRIYGLGVPVVIGPMNGGMNYPPGYEIMESKVSRLFMRAGRSVGWLFNNLVFPGKRRATHLLVANQRTARALPVTTSRVVEIIENGVDFNVFSPTPARAPRDSAGVSMIFMGRLVAWKAVDMTLDAMSRAKQRAPDLPITLDIVGDGPEADALKALAQARGLEDVVNFHGFVMQPDCLPLMRKADVLILNSLRECGGAVVLEAMSQQLAVIASDWGGPADYLDESCGILVPPSPAETFTDRLADAMLTLAKDPARTRIMGENGLSRVRDRFDWDEKIRRIEAIYTEAIEIRAQG